MDEFFPQLDEEIYSTNLVRNLTLYGIVILGIVTPILQLGLMRLINKCGQPWQRVVNAIDNGVDFQMN